MAKASDPRLTEVTKKRPLSAPKPGQISEIPQIILSERKETPPSLPSSLSSSVHSGAFSCQGRYGVEVAEGHLGVGTQGHVTGSNVPGKSSSDIGLPATSMPNLSARDDAGSNESYLEVFCSPRTFRRSVDFDINSKEHTRGHFEWVDATESSANSLKVLTTSSRVGSALSLTSECTARSIGLLSNDSDSENDLSLTESEKLSTKPPHLRRFMSYPEDGVSSDLCARPSQSMSDIKVMDRTKVESQVDSDAVVSVSHSVDVTVTPDIQELGHAVDDHEPANGGRMSSDWSSSTCDPRLQEKLIRAHKKEIYRDRSRVGTARSSQMLSYKCDSHDLARDGRIRQWLQDMDSQS